MRYCSHDFDIESLSLSNTYLGWGGWRQTSSRRWAMRILSVNSCHSRHGSNYTIFHKIPVDEYVKISVLLNEYEYLEIIKVGQVFDKAWCVHLFWCCLFVFPFSSFHVFPILYSMVRLNVLLRTHFFPYWASLYRGPITLKYLSLTQTYCTYIFNEKQTESKLVFIYLVINRNLFSN